MQSERSVRPAAGEYDEHYASYVRRVPDGDVVETLAAQLAGTVGPLRLLDASRGAHAYAPGKWTVRQVIGHISDAERVFAQRAFRFARGDQTPLPSFDEDAYVPAGEFDQRTLADLLDELAAVRAATIALFRNLPASAWTRTGTASNASVSVRALAWIAAGHELHHRALLAERYGIPMASDVSSGPAA